MAVDSRGHVASPVHTSQDCPVVNMAADSEELSDNESEAGQAQQLSGTRRLRLIWNNEWHRDVRTA